MAPGQPAEQSSSSSASTTTRLRRPPHLLRPSYLLSGAGSTVSLSVPTSTTTSVGLNLASLPSTPSPIGVSGSYERNGYFSMISSVLHSPNNSTVGRTVDEETPNTIPRRRRGSDSVSTSTTSSSSSPPGAAGILAQLSSSSESPPLNRAPRAPPPYLAQLARSTPAPARAAMPPTPPLSERQHTATTSAQRPALRGDLFDTPASRGSVSTFASGTGGGTPASTYSAASLSASASAAPPALSNISVSAEASPSPSVPSPAPPTTHVTSRLRAGISASKSLPRLAHPSQPSVSVQRSSVGFMPKLPAASTATASQGGGNVYMPRSQSASDRLTGMLQQDARASTGTHTPNAPASDRQSVRSRTTSTASSRSIPPASGTTGASGESAIPTGTDSPSVSVSLVGTPSDAGGAPAGPTGSDKGAGAQATTRSSGSSRSSIAGSVKASTKQTKSPSPILNLSKESSQEPSKAPSKTPSTAPVAPVDPSMAQNTDARAQATPAEAGEREKENVKTKSLSPSSPSPPPPPTHSSVHFAQPTYTQSLKPKTSQHVMPSSDPIARSHTASPGGSERSAGSTYRTPLDHSPTVTAPSSPAVVPRPTPRRARSSRKGSADKDRLDSDKAWLPTGISDTEREIELNDVEEAPSRSETTVGSSTAAATETKADDDPTTATHTDTYVPLYEPRKRPAPCSPASSSSSIADKKALVKYRPHQPQRYALTFTAALSSAADLPFDRRRIELEVLWDPAPAPSIWDYVPGARYVPAWRLRAAGKRSGAKVEEGVVRWALGMIPVVGGVAREWL